MSLVCEGFERQAVATARGFGFDGLALAVLEGHVDSQSYDAMIASIVGTTIDQIVEGLTAELENDEAGVTEPAALDVAASGSIEEINRIFRERGWSDGLPIVPPTREQVEAFLLPLGS